ncbi:hypothetical protein Y1Q_0008810 [Alligator mississippiensis]|uniref:Uncharacterized protein n=1 Tax=Alligator mississippiensis TaxID=8496 RepID=A0A151NA36_ALLMI|nr:hypothetical protein Y1Q_0008810 [Alligator mississippiensis]
MLPSAIHWNTQLKQATEWIKIGNKAWKKQVEHIGFSYYGVKLETLSEDAGKKDPPTPEEMGGDTGMYGEVTLAKLGDVLKVTQEVFS